MNDIIGWMIGIEANAADLYAKAAVAFRDDEEFSKLLLLMSLEEKEHERLLHQASVSISDIQMKKASFSLDDDFRRKIEAPFVRAWKLLNSNELTKSVMIDIVAEVEFAEWNDVFIYTIDTLNSVAGGFQKAVSEIDEHRAHVQKYISSLPDGDRLIQRFRRLSQSTQKRVLIVEDNYSVARMLEALAMDEVEVVIARNGEEGISHIQQGHFDLVVSEIEMPKMNGVEMYKQALMLDPTLSSRFIFFTGTEDQGHLDFVRTTNILMLPKPSPVKVICEMMNDVLDSTTVPKGSTVH